MNPPTAAPARPLRFRVGLLALVVVGAAASALLFAALRRTEDAHLRGEFERDARDRFSAVAEEVGHGLEALVALESLYARSAVVSREDFRRFTRHLFEHHESIQALEWIERVEAADRERFESAMRREGSGGFRITERDVSGRMVPAAERPTYFPVTFVEPLRGNEPAVGFDLGSEPRRLEALRKARTSGRPVATGRLSLVQDEEAKVGFLTVSPVFGREPATTPGSIGPGALKGYVLVVFRLADMVELALANLEPRGIDLAVYDAAVANPERLIHFHPSRTRRGLAARAPEAVRQAPAPRAEQALQVADRSWLMVARPTLGYVDSRQTWIPWGAFLGGLLLTGLLMARLSAVARRTEESEAFARRLLGAKRELEKEVQERRRAETVAIESEEKYRSLAESTFDGVAVTEEGVIVETNEAFARTFGYQPGEMFGMPVAERLVAPEHREDVRSKIREQYDRPYETTCVRKDGTRFPVEACGRPIPYQGRVARVTAIRDLSDRKRAERERLKTEKLSSLGVLAGGLAHDFNNLLTVMLGNIDLARLDAEPGSAVEEHLVEAEQAARRAAAVTRQLLTFSKGGAPVRQVVHLDQLVRETAIFTSRGSNVKCEFELADGLWAVEVDSGQIGQVLSNLVLNAIQAMPEGGTVRVRGGNWTAGADGADTLKPGRYVRIEVTDSGVGILAEHLERVFDPYFSTKQEGSGLGLATAYSIARQHHGLITVESEVGGGSTFTLYLPASEREPAGLLERERQPASGRGRILLMDDEEGVRQVVCAMLGNLGYDCECAASGEEALAAYRAAQERGDGFAAVILDLTVPGGMGGLETLQRLRELDREVRALVASGYSNDPVLANYAEHGFSGRVAKPFRAAELGQVLSSVLAASSVAG